MIGLERSWDIEFYEENGVIVKRTSRGTIYNGSAANDLSMKMHRKPFKNETIKRDLSEFEEDIISGVDTD